MGAVPMGIVPLVAVPSDGAEVATGETSVDDAAGEGPVVAAPPVAAGPWGDPVPVASSTGQIVVETATTLVSVLVVWDSAGQSATSAAQAVTVAVCVE